MSVLLPARNAAATIDAAVASVVGQSFRDWELVAVDDHSTDGTGERLWAWQQRDARIRVVQGSGQGIVAALRVGLAACTGELIARMDADDVSAPPRLGLQVERLRAEPSLGLVGCAVRFVGDPAQQPGYARYVDWLNSFHSAEAIALYRFIESPLAHPSVMFRRALLERHEGYREGEFPEDYELWLRWIEAGVRMEKLPATLLDWFDSPSRLSRRDSRYSADAFFRIKARYLAAEIERLRGGRALWVWGAGRPTRKRAAYLEEAGSRIAGYIDIDPRKIGQILPGGCEVVGPDRLGAVARTFVVGYVTNPGARELIRARLDGGGFREGADYLMAA